MKKLIYNKTILLFLNINDISSLKFGELMSIKNDYLKEYDNCIIYNYFELKNHKNLIKDKIDKIKFQNQKKINARDCIIRYIDSKIKNDFLNEYHIQGTDKSQIYCGGYYNDELVSVMTFDNKKNMNGGILDNEYDLSRFSIKNGCIIVGIFNKMLSKFINDYSPKKIISFADLNLVNRYNNIYEKNMFKLVKTIRPDYKIYLKNKNELFHKFTYGNRFIKNAEISENTKSEIINNSIKLWNCGKLKYELCLVNNKIIFGSIYGIKNKLNDKIYIGQTTRALYRRIWEYRSAYRCNAFHNQYLSNAFYKYGWDNFEFTIIDTAETIDELNEKEIFYINKYNSNNRKFGYNLELGGNNSIPSAETLEKMSKSHQGIKQNENWVNKRIAVAGSDDAKKYGKPKTELEKNLLSQNSPKYWLGKSRDEETKKRISQTKLSKGISDKQKLAICKQVNCVDINTNTIINTFESTADAANSIGVNQSTISRWCSKNKIINNIKWTY